MMTNPLAILAVVAVAGVSLLAAPSSAVTISSQSNPVRITGVKGNFGTNVVYKAAPWHPDTSANESPQWSFNQQDIDILADYGVTAIRLRVMWPGVEPVRGQYNMTYLEVMKGIVQACQDAGIYVLLEMHQDGLSEKFCGEGVPMWAAQPMYEGSKILGFPFPVASPDTLNADGSPQNICNTIFCDKLQFSIAAGSAFERLYTNYNGLTDSFVNYWKLVAKTFLPFKNILGYDLMNEPFAGNVVSNPGLAVPGYADGKLLAPFYDAIASGIRSVDSNAIIFFESVTWDNFVVGFPNVPGGSKFGSKSVLSFHHYQPSPNLLDLNATLLERSIDMLRLGCGGMLTEFEMGWQNGNNIQAIREKSLLMERNFWSYTGWEYTDYVAKTGTNNGLRDPATGLVREDMARVYSRTYATAIPGVPQSPNFDDATGTYTLEFNHDGSVNPLEIRLNTILFYPKGVNSKVLVNGADRTLLQVLTGSSLPAGASTSFMIIALADTNAKVAPGSKVSVTHCGLRILQSRIHFHSRLQ